MRDILQIWMSVYENIFLNHVYPKKAIKKISIVPQKLLYDPITHRKLLEILILPVGRKIWLLAGAPAGGHTLDLSRAQVTLKSDPVNTGQHTLRPRSMAARHTLSIAAADTTSNGPRYPPQAAILPHVTTPISIPPNNRLTTQPINSLLIKLKPFHKNTSYELN